MQRRYGAFEAELKLSPSPRLKPARDKIAQPHSRSPKASDPDSELSGEELAVCRLDRDDVHSGYRTHSTFRKASRAV